MEELISQHTALVTGSLDLKGNFQVQTQKNPTEPGQDSGPADGHDSIHKGGKPQRVSAQENGSTDWKVEWKEGRKGEATGTPTKAKTVQRSVWTEPGAVMVKWPLNHEKHLNSGENASFCC